MAELSDALLDGMAVLVTGGTQGLGAGVATAAARNGADLVVTGRRTDVGEQFAAELAERSGRRIHYVRADAADFVVFLLSPRTGVVTGSVLDWDQVVPGADD